MKRRYYFIGGLVLLLIVVQFIPNALPIVETNNPQDLIATRIVDENVSILLKNSCYNCHSNETVYPWYSYVAPSSWLVAEDVREAREELNFSDWQEFDMMDWLGKLDDIVMEVGEGRMPLGIYTAMHPTAKLDDSQRQLMVEWAEATMDIVAEEEEEDNQNL